MCSAPSNAKIVSRSSRELAHDAQQRRLERAMAGAALRLVRHAERRGDRALLDREQAELAQARRAPAHERARDRTRRRRAPRAASPGSPTAAPRASAASAWRRAARRCGPRARVGAVVSVSSRDLPAPASPCSPMICSSARGARGRAPRRPGGARRVRPMKRPWVSAMPRSLASTCASTSAPARRPRAGSGCAAPSRTGRRPGSAPRSRASRDRRRASSSAL